VKYEVLIPIRIEGRPVAAGAEVELRKVQAAYLMAAGKVRLAQVKKRKRKSESEEGNA